MQHSGLEDFPQSLDSGVKHFPAPLLGTVISVLSCGETTKSQFKPRRLLGWGLIQRAGWGAGWGAALRLSCGACGCVCLRGSHNISWSAPPEHRLVHLGNRTKPGLPLWTVSRLGGLAKGCSFYVVRFSGVQTRPFRRNGADRFVPRVRAGRVLLTILRHSVKHFQTSRTLFHSTWPIADSRSPR